MDRAERHYFPGECGWFIVTRAQLYILLGLVLSALDSSFRFRYGPLEKPDGGREQGLHQLDPGPGYAVAWAAGGREGQLCCWNWEG